MSSKKIANAALPPVTKKIKDKKARPQKANKRPPTTLQAQAANIAPSNRNDVISCYVNPYLLTEFLFGYFARGLSDNDAPYDASIVSSLTYTVLTLLNNGDILGIGVRSLPREIVDLYWSLRTTTYGGRTFYCNMSIVNTFIQSVTTNGWTSMTGLLDCTYPTSATGTNGFYNCANTPSYLSSNLLRDVFAQYGSSFHMVDVIDKSRACIDVFSFDIQTPCAVNNFTGASVTMYALAGYVSSTIQSFIKQDSFVGLEVKPKNPSWMAHLRLCTPTPYIKQASVILADPTRYPNHATPVHAFPSVIGHQMGSNRHEYKGVVQLKLVPMVGCLNDIISRLEAAITASGQVANWTSAFTAQEIKLLAYGLWRSANSRYAASAYGVVAVSGSGSTNAETTYDSAGYKLFQTIRIPQVINDCLQAQKVFSDKDGVLIPAYARLSDLNALTVGINYTGSGITAIPSDTGTTSYRYFARCMDIVNKYKLYEQGLAGICKITTITAFGNSMLDVTVTRDNSSQDIAGNVLLVSSRRPLTTPLVMASLLKLAYVSYDYAVPSSVPFQVATGSEDRTKIYRQRYCVPLSGADSVSKLITCAVKDGLVPLGAEADNATPFTAGDIDPIMAPSVSKTYGGLGYKLMSQVSPFKDIKYGNYGGPGYTAGSRDPKDWKHKDGKYLEPAIDDEDFVYKTHDEAILAAKGDYSREIMADSKLYQDLVELSKHKDLSVFGKAAKYYFAPKHDRDRTEL